METLEEIEAEIHRLEQERIKVYRQVHNDYALASIMKNLDDKLLALRAKRDYLKK